MRTPALVAWMAAPLTLLLTACDLPGKPRPGPEIPRPEAVLSFDQLYGENCSGCHGAKGEYGSAAQLANPEYQALVDDATLRDTIAKGFKGTLMPAFGAASGGSLTDRQIDVLVQGMREGGASRMPLVRTLHHRTKPHTRATRAKA